MNLEDQILTIIAKKMQEEIDELFMSEWKYKPNFKIHDESVVDGEIWYTVGCCNNTSEWLRTQDQKLWYEHINNKFLVINHLFDIHEKLYTMLALRWS